MGRLGEGEAPRFRVIREIGRRCWVDGQGERVGRIVCSGKVSPVPRSEWVRGNTAKAGWMAFRKGGDSG